MRVAYCFIIGIAKQFLIFKMGDPFAPFLSSSMFNKADKKKLAIFFVFAKLIT